MCGKSVPWQKHEAEASDFFAFGSLCGCGQQGCFRLALEGIPSERKINEPAHLRHETRPRLLFLVIILLSFPLPPLPLHIFFLMTHTHFSMTLMSD